MDRPDETAFRTVALATQAKVRLLGLDRKRPRDLTPAEDALMFSFYVNCHKCGAHTSNYMVHDHVWESAGLAFMGCQRCLTCLGEDLGRALTIDDFQRGPRCNDILFFVYGMSR